MGDSAIEGGSRESLAHDLSQVMSPPSPLHARMSSLRHKLVAGSLMLLQSSA